MNIDYNNIMIIDYLIYKYRELILYAHIIDAGQLTLP